MHTHAHSRARTHTHTRTQAVYPHTHTRTQAVYLCSDELLIAAGHLHMPDSLTGEGGGGGGGGGRRSEGEALDRTEAMQVPLVSQRLVAAVPGG